VKFQIAEKSNMKMGLNRDPIPEVMDSRSAVLGSHTETNGITEKSNMKMG